MSKLDEYMKRNYRLVIVRDKEEGGFTAYYPELDGCITCAEDKNDILRMAEDARKEWLKAAMEDKMPIPDAIADKNYSGQFKLRIPKVLHRRLVEEAQEEGISLNQLCVYKLSSSRISKIKS
ncbi:MAG: type II toxin-antitoxin system HicB family antitoxin [Lachnospiraceae bacterium]|jgi:predicted RNase H-like HicB family nuclease|nr:type II toxin-antitoxin system HicB family antitoxin [Lachnospiraceae bacterium]